MPKNTSVLIIVVFFIETGFSYTHNYNIYPYRKIYTEELIIKQGLIKGVVVNPENNENLSPVEHYLGIPYAAPPVGDLRFMPPRDAPSWENVKYADSFGPVCPQMFPDPNTFAPKRKEEFLRLKDYLLNESEDCLYLNVYVPHEGKKYF
ncbi:hypothetical protein WA026_003270 [Henosepilachna vigintioctopunctata]|uniref:Carboxylesterase type B domain-containing protein n=1 Tax=Henosepilachna vigintioctopunctata TaxID=420089 RepID=A0AAW1THB8_9CUCU